MLTCSTVDVATLKVIYSWFSVVFVPYDHAPKYYRTEIFNTNILIQSSWDIHTSEMDNYTVRYHTILVWLLDIHFNNQPLILSARIVAPSSILPRAGATKQRSWRLSYKYLFFTFSLWLSYVFSLFPKSMMGFTRAFKFSKIIFYQ